MSLNHPVFWFNELFAGALLAIVWYLITLLLLTSRIIVYLIRLRLDTLPIGNFDVLNCKFVDNQTI